MTKLNNAVAAVCITIIAVSWGGYAKDYLIENQRLEESRNATRMIELMQRSGLSPTPFQKPLIEIDPSKGPLEKLSVIASPLAMASILSEARFDQALGRKVICLRDSDR